MRKCCSPEALLQRESQDGSTPSSRCFKISKWIFMSCLGTFQTAAFVLDSGRVSLHKSPLKVVSQFPMTLGFSWTYATFFFKPRYSGDSSLQCRSKGWLGCLLWAWTPRFSGWSSFWDLSQLWVTVFGVGFFGDSFSAPPTHLDVALLSFAMEELFS